MKFNADDPKLTAYVLGELEPDECAKIEERMAACADTRRAVEEIREMTELLGSELGAEPCPPADPRARDAVEAALSTNGAAEAGVAADADAGAPPRRFFLSSGVRFAIAAALLMTVAVGAWYTIDQGARDEMSVDHAGLSDVDNNELYRNAKLQTMGYIVDADPKKRATQSRLEDLGYVQDEPLDELGPEERKRLPLLGYSKIQEASANREQLQESYDRLTQGAPPVLDEFKQLITSEDFAAGHALYYKGEIDGLALLNAEAPKPNSPTVYHITGAQPQNNVTGVTVDPAIVDQLKSLGYADTAAGNEKEVARRLRRLGYVTDEPQVMWEAEAKKLAAEKLGLKIEASKALRDSINTLRESLDNLQQPQSESGFDTEAYDAIVENEFISVGDDPRSTFSIDVDTASYANVRRFLKGGQLPPPGAVRIEELVNYFAYDYPLPEGDVPFSATLEAAACPWNPQNRLVRVGLKGREIPEIERPTMNLVFLLDVSGSMNDANKLPLVRESMKILVETLRPDDRVAIVVYAGASGLVLDSTEGYQKQAILSAIDSLRPGGSTNGAAGIQLAYDIATRNFVEGGANRVILATDGDFNVGVTNQSELVNLIQEKAKTGVEITVLGYGMGNLKDSTLEKLADKGNGSYGYIDSLHEAQKWFVDQVAGTLFTIAKDVKIQIEFNPEQVASHRLIGYENRKLAHRDFNDDTKDAGEIGSGLTVTALYEIVPRGAEDESVIAKTDPLKYQGAAQRTPEAMSGEMLALKIRYKRPDTPEDAEGRRNGKFDEPEPYTDINESGTWESGEPFMDSNKNGVWDDGDTYTDANGNGRYDVGEPYEDHATKAPPVASELLTFPLVDPGTAWGGATPDFKFAAAVAAFGMELRRSQHRAQSSLDLVLELAREAMGLDRFGYRKEFLEMVEQARALQAQVDRSEKADGVRRR